MSDLRPTIVLASASPRRAELLFRLGLPFVARVSGVDESGLEHLSPPEQALELARLKARSVWQRGEWVLAADTVVALAGQVLGKPADPAENRVFLRLLSGRQHTVFTGLALLNPAGAEYALVEPAEVFFRALADWEIGWYVASGEGMDKAGGYGVQGKGMVLVERIEGDFYTVMGLPMARAWGALAQAGYPLAAGER
ncbi:MAG: septum formation protein Maf [Meiothermus sp.]